MDDRKWYIWGRKLHRKATGRYVVGTWQMLAAATSQKEAHAISNAHSDDGVSKVVLPHGETPRSNRKEQRQ